MLNAGLPQPLAAWLRQEIQHINQQHLRREDVDTRTEILPGITTPAFADAPDVALPAALSLICYDTPGLCDLASMLQTRLKKRGCDVNIQRKDREAWHAPDALAQGDILLGDYLAGEVPVFALAEWFTEEPAWAAALGQTAWQKEKQTLMTYCESEKTLKSHLPAFFQHLLESGACTPLFHYRYRLNTLENVQDIVLTASGWLDFTRAWLPPVQERTTSAS